MQVGQQILLQKFLFKISQLSIQGDRVLPCRLTDMTKLGHFSNCFVKMPKMLRNS